jgi:thioredoxin reductase (NADPH)
MSQILDTAFPQLSDAEIAILKDLATPEEYSDGAPVFHAGQADIDLYVVESGHIEIRNPSNGNRLIVTHDAGQFTGDIDVLTRRPVVVSAQAKGASRIMRVPYEQVRTLLNRAPTLAEKLLVAFMQRRELLSRLEGVGMRVVGPARCRATNTVREFLYKNFVPFTWRDPDSEEGKRILEKTGSRKMPVIDCGEDQVLVAPKLQELACAAKVWRHCPHQEVQFAIVGAGPAGLAAAVYAASEGLSTLVLDKLGPGGQAGTSSHIENFIGFPAGLDGNELAMRGVLQMLKFGARMVAPVDVQKVTPAKAAGDCHVLHLDCGAEIRCHVLLLALGVLWRRLECDGAEGFAEAGVYHACTTVEADLYDGADVAVVGAGNSAGQAAMFLAECCPTRKVHLLVRRTLGPSMSDYLVNRIRAARNIVVHEHTEIDTVHGGRQIEELTLKHSGSDSKRRLRCSAVFVFIGAEPSAPWLPADIGRDSQGYLLTGGDVIRSGKWPRRDRDPCPLETTIPGVLAAGDIRSGSTKRVGFAVGDGSLAVTCAHRLVSIRP